VYRMFEKETLNRCAVSSVHLSLHIFFHGFFPLCGISEHPDFLRVKKNFFLTFAFLTHLEYISVYGMS
jgi:hypothetical protein